MNDTFDELYANEPRQEQPDAVENRDVFGTIVKQIEDDGDGWKECEYLIHLYNASSQRDRWLVNYILTCVCGWTLPTLASGHSKDYDTELEGYKREL
jgi:hypothetical protein